MLQLNGLTFYYLSVASIVMKRSHTLEYCYHQSVKFEEEGAKKCKRMK